MGISSKLLLDATGTQGSELDSICSLNDRGRTLTELCAGSSSTAPAQDEITFCRIDPNIQPSNQTERGWCDLIFGLFDMLLNGPNVRS